MKKPTAQAKPHTPRPKAPKMEVEVEDNLPGVPDEPETEETTEEELPPFVIYVSYWWKSAKGNRSGFAASCMRVHFPDITTQTHIEAVVGFLASNNGYDELTIISWRALEG